MRQASCDVLSYPITPVFFCSSDVKRPGGFVKKRNKERNRAKKKIFLRCYATRLDAEHAVSNYQM